MNCFRFIASVESDHPVALSCRVLNVSRSGFYAWRQRPPCARSVADATLADQIHQIYVASHGTYGSPRVHAELRDPDGPFRSGCSRKRVARLMRRARLVGCHRRRWRPPRTWCGGISRRPPSPHPTGCGWQISSATRRSQPCGDERTPPAARRSEPMKLRAARPIGTGGVGGQQP